MNLSRTTTKEYFNPNLRLPLLQFSPNLIDSLRETPNTAIYHDNIFLELRDNIYAQILTSYEANGKPIPLDSTRGTYNIISDQKLTKETYWNVLNLLNYEKKIKLHDHNGGLIEPYSRIKGIDGATRSLSEDLKHINTVHGVMDITGNYFSGIFRNVDLYLYNQDFKELKIIKRFPGDISSSRYFEWHHRNTIYSHLIEGASRRGNIHFFFDDLQAAANKKDPRVNPTSVAKDRLFFQDPREAWFGIMRSSEGEIFGTLCLREWLHKGDRGASIPFYGRDDKELVNHALDFMTQTVSLRLSEIVKNSRLNNIRDIWEKEEDNIRFSYQTPYRSDLGKLIVNLPFPNILTTPPISKPIMKSTSFFENIFTSDSSALDKFLQKVPAEILEIVGGFKSLLAFKRAAKTVPAYAKFLNEKGIDPNQIRSIKDVEKIPDLTKDNYIKAFLPKPNAAGYDPRYVGGKLPDNGVLDGSGGTSGKIMFFSRVPTEEKGLVNLLKWGMTQVYGTSKKRTLVVVCWELSTWVTGVKFVDLVKGKNITVATPGQNLDQALKILTENADNYEQILITGYPPFVKFLVDKGKEIKFEWDKKDRPVHVLTGGEGVTLAWWKHMKEALGPDSINLSAFGTSEMNIGVAHETHFSVFLRLLASDSMEFRKKLFGNQGVLPMIFQYNPLNYGISGIPSTSLDGRNISLTRFTANNFNTPFPLINYVVGDEGGVLSFNTVQRLLDEMKINPKDKMKQYGMNMPAKWQPYRLPILFINGRSGSEGTISFAGTNIFPDDIQTIVYKYNEMDKVVNTFKLFTTEDKDKNMKFGVMFELKEDLAIDAEKKKEMCERFAHILEKEMKKVNPQYKNMCDERSASSEIVVKIYDFGHKEFKSDKGSAKFHHIEKKQ